MDCCSCGEETCKYVKLPPGKQVSSMDLKLGIVGMRFEVGSHWIGEVEVCISVALDLLLNLQNLLWVGSRF